MKRVWHNGDDPDLIFAPTAHVLFTAHLHVLKTLDTPCSITLASSYVNLRIADNLYFVKHILRPPRSYISAIQCTECKKKKPNKQKHFSVCYKTFKHYEHSKGHLAYCVFLQPAIGK
jgi:hypothetical protein